MRDKNNKHKAKKSLQKQQNNDKSDLSTHARPALATVRGLNESHEAAIDEYHLNGFNGWRAVMDTGTGETTPAAARVQWSRIINHPANKDYIERKRAELKRATAMSNELILRELIGWAYADATHYIDLTAEQLKALPPEARRAIQSIEIKRTSYTTREGDPMTEETTRIKLVDKARALENIGKHVGFYEADNRQKAARININNLPASTINILLNHLNESTGDQ